MTATLYPGVIFSVFFVLNLFIWGQKSSGAVPFSYMFAILVLWFGISVPLVFLGSYFGFRREVSFFDELTEMCAESLQAKSCRIVSTDGKILSALDGKSHVTAVALNINPLLQLVGLQSASGDMADERLPVAKLEHRALLIAEALAKTAACCYGGPFHLGGKPRIHWLWEDVLPLSGKRALTLEDSTPVVHVGARVVFSIQDGSPCSQAGSLRLRRPMTVQDICDIRRAHQDACDERQEELLAEFPGAESVRAVMDLKSYTADKVEFQLGHRDTKARQADAETVRRGEARESFFDSALFGLRR
ncbi:unnamed protein product [Effrenium voratum]|nr:unnamed protein product [Effrenium voratum]